jgi:flavodoxin I
MKTLVVYDSLYGNTKIVAETIAAALSGEVSVQHVEEADASSVGAYDLLIVGAPIHGARPSEKTRAFLDRIPASALQGVHVAAFDTRVTNKFILLFGTAAPKIAKTLRRKGGTLAADPAGLIVTGTEGPLKEGELERAAAWAAQIAEGMRLRAIG